MDSRTGGIFPKGPEGIPLEDAFGTLRYEMDSRKGGIFPKGPEGITYGEG